MSNYFRVAARIAVCELWSCSPAFSSESSELFQVKFNGFCKYIFQISLYYLKYIFLNRLNSDEYYGYEYYILSVYYGFKIPFGGIFAITNSNKLIWLGSATRYNKLRLNSSEMIWYDQKMITTD